VSRGFAPAIGAPLEGVSSTYDAGAVNVLHGSSAGLSATAVPDQVWTQNTASVEETAEDDDTLGSAVAVGDFNGDGYSESCRWNRGWPSRSPSQTPKACRHLFTIR
jgi:hypothetical protein